MTNFIQLNRLYTTQLTVVIPQLVKSATCFGLVWPSSGLQRLVSINVLICLAYRVGFCISYPLYSLWNPETLQGGGAISSPILGLLQGAPCVGVCLFSLSSCTKT